MAILIVPALDLLAEIAATPNLDGGIGPVLIGAPAELADGRFAVAHPWSAVSIDWLAGYVQGIEGVEVLEGDVLPYPLKERIRP